MGNRARDAESTLRRLLGDLNGIREFTETPPLLAASMANVAPSIHRDASASEPVAPSFAAPPPTVPALQPTPAQNTFGGMEPIVPALQPTLAQNTFGGMDTTHDAGIPRRI